jgi:hypothetical protein
MAPPLSEVEMKAYNWKLAILAAAIGVMSGVSNLAIAQSNTDIERQRPQGLRDTDISRQQPQGLLDEERQRPQGLKDADQAGQQPQGPKDADQAGQQPQGPKDSK